jgi:hypothetical protein
MLNRYLTCFTILRMRDTHEGYPEIIDTYERDGLYFGAVRVTLATEAATFEFGVDKSGYLSLKRVLQSSPFEPHTKHRYFFRGSFTKRELDSDVVTFGIRIEQDANAKGFDFDGPASLVSNLLWFQSLKDFQSTTSLKLLS